MRTNELGYRLGNQPVSSPRAAELYFTNSLVGDVSALIAALVGTLRRRKAARRDPDARAEAGHAALRYH